MADFGFTLRSTCRVDFPTLRARRGGLYNNPPAVSKETAEVP